MRTKVLTGLLEKNFVRLDSEEFIPLLRVGWKRIRELGIGELGIVESVLLNMSKGYVYFRTNFQRTTLYIGFTSNLARRIWEHKQGKGSEFTSKYKLAILVYTEEFDSIVDAIDREKQLKNWHKEWNPKLEDWYETLRG